MSVDLTIFLHPVADYAKMASRLNSDIVICGEDDFRLPVEESSEKEKETTDPAEVETLSKILTCPPFGTHEYSGSLEVHMQPLQKIMSHSKSPR